MQYMYFQKSFNSHICSFVILILIVSGQWVVYEYVLQMVGHKNIKMLIHSMKCHNSFNVGWTLCHIMFILHLKVQIYKTKTKIIKVLLTMNFLGSFLDWSNCSRQGHQCNALYWPPWYQQKQKCCNLLVEGEFLWKTKSPLSAINNPILSLHFCMKNGVNHTFPAIANNDLQYQL